MARYCQWNTAKEDMNYELFSISIHIGTLEMGHYIAYSKRKGQWFRFNDEDVQKVNDEEALNQEAYLLFYRKKVEIE